MIQAIFELLRRGLLDMRDNPWAQAMTFAVVALVAFLGGMFLLCIHNLDAELSRVRGDVLFQVYWDKGSDKAKIDAQCAEIRQLPDFKDLTLFTPAEALDSLSKELGEGFDLDAFRQDNPLPWTALVAFSPQAAAAEDADKASDTVLRYLRGLPGVAKVRYNPLNTEMARAWARFSKGVLWPLLLFLSLALALVVGDTVKLSLLLRRDEIEILHLVGATRLHIQLPLLTAGLVQGLGGSLLALAMLKAVQAGLEDLLASPPLFLRFEFLPGGQCLLLAFGLTAVAVASSWIAVRRY